VVVVVGGGTAVAEGYEEHGGDGERQDAAADDGREDGRLAEARMVFRGWRGWGG
jgi:hypothetical protein